MCMKDQEECEQAYLANGKAEDSDERDSEDDTAYMNNVEDSAFLVNKLKDSKISSPQKSTNKGNKSSKSDEKEDKEEEVNQQNNIKMSKLKKNLEEIASQNKIRKTESMNIQILWHLTSVVLQKK